MTLRWTHLFRGLAVLLALNGDRKILAQGTITFDAHPLWNGTNYFEASVAFQVMIPQGSSYDAMGIVPPNWANNVPQDSSPFLWWFRQFNPSDYVSLSLTNGSLFGLGSVQLADPNSPSLSPVPISFIGYLFGGSTVTNTFTTPGNGATTFANYTFSSQFSSGLTHVDILASRWAMDNLVFTVPEPGALALVGLGALALGARCSQRRIREALAKAAAEYQVNGSERVGPIIVTFMILSIFAFIA